jgi:hypothetical protein
MSRPNGTDLFGRHPGKQPARMKCGTLKGKPIRARAARIGFPHPGSARAIGRQADDAEERIHRAPKFSAHQNLRSGERQ